MVCRIFCLRRDLQTGVLAPRKLRENLFSSALSVAWERQGIDHLENGVCIGTHRGPQHAEQAFSNAPDRR